LFVLDISRYAMFEGFLALLLAYLFFWYLLYISKKKQLKQSLDGYSPPAYDLRFFPSTVAPAALCLFVLLLVFLEQKTSAPAFLMGVLSSAVLVLLSNRAASPAVLTGLSVYQRGLIAGLTRAGIGLAGIGFFYHTIIGGEDTAVVGAYALGAGFVLFFASRKGKRESESASKTVYVNLDAYVSYVAVLVSAMIVGENLAHNYQVWVGMAVLITMAGLAVTAVAGPILLAVNEDKGGKALCYITGAAVLAFMACVYHLDRKLTATMAANAIAGSGMVDRLGPFWSAATGCVSALIMRVLCRRFPSSVLFVYFVSMGLWIAYLFSGLYGMAVAGVGMMGTFYLDVAVSNAGGDGSSEAGKFILVVSSFSTFAILAAFSAVVRSYAGEEDLLIDLTRILTVACIVLGGLTVRLMPILEKRFNRPGHEALLLTVALAVPCAVGTVLGPEPLVAFIAGLVVVGTLNGLTGRTEAHQAISDMGIIRLTALVSLVFAPVISSLYESLR